jgi:cytoskeleton protein RodZ
VTHDEFPPAQADASAEVAATAGERLKAAREQAGMSVEDVSRQLKLAPRQILAIERDDHASLPGRTFVRGFVRNYARLLKLDADAVLAALPGEGGSANLERTALAPTPPAMGELPRESHGARPVSRWAIPLVLVAIIAIAAVYELARPPAPPPGRTPPPDRPPAADPVVQPLANPVGSEPARTDAPPPAVETKAKDAPPPVATSAPPTTAPAGGRPASSERVVPSGVTSQPLVNPLAAVSPAPAAAGLVVPPAAGPTSAPAIAVAPPSPPIAPAAANPAPAPSSAVARAPATLTLTFRGTSWIEVRDRGGSVVLSMTGNDGASRDIAVAPPGELTVGNAS